MPPQITCASALPRKTGKHENRIFHSNAISVHCQNSTSRSLISSVSLTHDSYSRCCTYDSLYLVVNVFSSGLLRGHGLRERKSIEPQQLDCVACTNAYAPVRNLPERKNVICDVFDSV